jgi:hypothetical protein
MSTVYEKVENRRCPFLGSGTRRHWLPQESCIWWSSRDGYGTIDPPIPSHHITFPCGCHLSLSRFPRRHGKIPLERERATVAKYRHHTAQQNAKN